MNDQAKCPECGKPMPEGGAHGLCPACLMGQAMASRTLDTRSEGAPQLEPPSPEEIADKFPQFEVVECLGRGGMGVVYKARQKSLDRWVAIKVLAPERVHEERFAEHFEREAKTLAKMSHPNIVTVFDHGETDGLFYIVMEFVDGVNLRDLLREGRMAPEQALAIVPPVCEALEFAHGKGVVHRDIKPENLLLDKDGRVKIADFGIASLVGATGEHSGTPPYMAPEQESGRVDRRADIYALGVVLYEMLTGERPAKELVEPSRKVQVDVKIDEMVLRALEKEPERRYQTAGEFRTVVETIAGEPGPERPGQAPEEDGWVIRCTACGKTRPFSETGGIRHKAASVGKRTLAFCRSCGKLRIAAIERGRAGDGELGPVAGRRWVWEPVLLVIGMFAGLALLINAKEAGGTVGVSLLFSGLVTLVVCAMGLAGIWPIPSPVLPGINFSSRNLGRPPAYGFRSRLASNLARVGVILGCLGFLGNFGSIPELSKWRVLLGLFGFFSLIGVAAMIEAFTRTRSVLGRCLVALGSVLVLLVALNFAWVLLSRNVLGPHLPGTKLVTVDLPRVSSLHLQGDPDCRYLDLDEKGSVTGLELPSNTDERTRTLNESGADLMVDLPQKMTSWSFVTPIEKPIRLAKVSMEYWKNPAILFDAAQAPPASAVVDATEPAPGDLEFLQVRGGALAFAVMPSRTMWNSELHAEVVDIPQRRAPADPESNVFFFETAEGTQGMLRVSGVTFDFSEDRDGLYVDHIVFTDRFVAEMSKRGRSIGDDWGEFVDAQPEPDTIAEQGGYARGGAKQGPHIPIDKSGLKLTAGDLSEIAGNKEVTHLDLTDSSISDDDLASLHDLPALRSVEFSATLADTAHKPRITDAGLEHVAHWKKLRSLQLVGMPVTDEGLKSLVHLSELSSLELNSTQVRGKGLRPFRNLNWLSLVATPVRDDDLRHLAGLQELEQLYLDLTDISDAGIRHLVGLKRLRILNLHRTRVTAEGIADLEARMPGISIGWDGPEESVAEAVPTTLNGVELRHMDAIDHFNAWERELESFLTARIETGDEAAAKKHHAGMEKSLQAYQALMRGTKLEIPKEVIDGLEAVVRAYKTGGKDAFSQELKQMNHFAKKHDFDPKVWRTRLEAFAVAEAELAGVGMAGADAGGSEEASAGSNVSPAQATEKQVAVSGGASREVALRNIIRAIQRNPVQHRIRIMVSKDGSYELNGHRLLDSDELVRVVEAFPPRRDHRMLEVVTENLDPEYIYNDFWKKIMQTMQAAETKFLHPDDLDADRELEIAVRGAWAGPGPEKKSMIFNSVSKFDGPDCPPAGHGEYSAGPGERGIWSVKDGILIRKITESRYNKKTGTFTNKIIEASDRMLVLEEEDGSRSEWYREIIFHGLTLSRFNSTTDRGTLAEFFSRREGADGVFDLHAKAREVYRSADGVVCERPDLKSYVVERYDFVDGVARFYGPFRGDPTRLKGLSKSEESSSSTADPKAAHAMAKTFKGHYAAAVEAVRKGDSETAIVSLKLIEGGKDDLLAALEGTPIQKAIEGGLRHLHQVTLALEAGELERAKTLMEGLDFSGPAFEKMIQEAAGARSRNESAKESKPQVFVPREGMERDSSWSVLPKGSQLHPEGWSILAEMTLGGSIRASMPGEKEPFLKARLIEGNDEWIKVEIRDLRLDHLSTLSLVKGVPASITIDGKGFRVLFSKTHVARDRPAESPFAHVMIFEESQE